MGFDWVLSLLVRLVDEGGGVNLETSLRAWQEHVSIGERDPRPPRRRRRPCLRNREGPLKCTRSCNTGYKGTRCSSTSPVVAGAGERVCRLGAGTADAGTGSGLGIYRGSLCLVVSFARWTPFLRCADFVNEMC